MRANIANAIKCNFDCLLHHFTYLIIDEDFDKKKTVNDLHTKIKELQEMKRWNLFGRRYIRKMHFVPRMS